MLTIGGLGAGCARVSGTLAGLRRYVLSVILVALVLVGALPARAQTFADPNFSSSLVATVSPFTLVGLRWAPNGDMFVWQKNGVVRVIVNGVLQPQPFLDFSAKVNTFDDRGMWGLAFDPNFETNHYVYLTYTYEDGGNPSSSEAKTSRLSRVTANPANPRVMLAGSEVIVLGSISVPPCTSYPTSADCIAADSGSHTIGDVRFGTDGKLYVGVGDGADAAFADPHSLRAQDLNSWNGKILRINPDGTAPGDNPFDDGTNSIRSKVYLYGVRNPFRFHFHPQTGEPYFGEVGWNTWEEVNHGVRGGDYGWPCYEGLGQEPEFQDAFPLCQNLHANQVIPPLYTYQHGGGGTDGGTASIGGPFYRGTAYPATYVDNLFFADYSGNWIRRLTFDGAGQVTGNIVFATGVAAPVSVELGPDGALYYLSFTTGQIRKIIFNGATAVATPAPAYGYSPLTVQFSSAGSDSGDGTALTYLWAFGDGATSTQQNPTHQYANTGVRVYAVNLTVTSTSGLSGTAQTTVTVGSTPPTPTISLPIDGTPMMPGQAVTLQGSATDPEDGPITGNALSWTVLLHHNTHIHTAVGGTGPTGGFVVENHGPIGTFSYEVILNATDSSGLIGSTSVTLPIVADTVPPGSVSGLSATPLTGRQMSLAWTAATDNAGIGLYRIERCLGSACTTFVEVATTAATTYLDTALSGSATYRYRVRAADASLNLGGYSNIASGTTDAGPAAGLAAAYSFDENTGATVLDLSGNGNTGSISGATWTTGKFGSALSFNGVNARVFVNSATSLNLGSAMTLEAWVQPTAAQSGWRTIIQRETDAYFLNGSNDSGALRPSGGASMASGTVWTSGTTPLTVGTWAHLALTYDGATLNLYVNGVLAATQAASGAIQASANPLWIGGNNPYGEYFQGLIDEVRVYTRALSQSEVQLDMTLPVNGTPTPDTTPPAVTITTPTNQATYGTTSGTVSLSGTATDNVGVTQVTWASSSGASGAASGTGAWSVAGIALQPGSNLFTVTAQDAAGNSSTDTLDVTYTPAGPDTTPPTVTITAPTNATTYSTTSGTLSLGGAATDNVAVTQVTWASSSGASGTASGTGAWSVTGIVLQSGSNLLTVTARDAANNTSIDTLDVTYTPDTTPPAVTITVPTNAATYSTTSGTLSLGGTATDNVAVTQVSWVNNRGGSGTATGTATWSAVIALQSGSNLLTVTVRDAANNTSTDTLDVTYTPTSAPGLVAAYAFDENTGVTVGDASGNSNTGTVTEAAWVPGRFGSALSFDGVNDRVFVNSSTSLNLSTGMTLEAWVQPTAAQSGWRTIVQREPDAYFLNGSNDSGALRPSGGGNFAGSTTWTSATTPLVVGTWTHLALTYNGSLVQLYVNGVATASTPASGGVLATTSPLWIGGNNPYGEYFKGLIDEVRIYNRALSAAEVQTDMTTPVGGGSAGPDTTAPTVPGSLAATAISGTRIDLSWGASTDNVGVTGYLLERCETPGCASFASLTTVSSGTTYSDTSAVAGTSYSYRVRARDAANNQSGNSNTATAVTPTSADTTPPAVTITAPTNAATYSTTSGTLSLGGTATDNVAVTQVTWTSSRGGSGTATGTGSWSVTGISLQSGSNLLTVTARDAANNTSTDTLDVTYTPADSTPPTAPTSLGATAVSSARIDLSWIAATDDVAVTAYVIERCAGVGCNGFATLTTVAPSIAYSDTTVAPATSYSYRISARDAATNQSVVSNTATAVTPAAPDTTAPTVPSGLTAVPASSARIDLSWTASTDNVGVTAYLLERCTGASCSTFAALATVTSGTTYADTTVSASTTYRYRVRARDAANNMSGFSNIANGVTPAAADTTAPTVPGSFTATAASATRINLAWTASTDNVAVTGYLVEKCQGSGCANFAALATVTSGTTYADTSLTAGTTFNYRVRARDAANNLSAFSSTATATTLDTTAPTAPSGLAVTAITTTRVDLGWNASTDNVGVTAYLLERCTGAGCTSWAALATVTAGTTYSDATVSASTTYRYRVRARDAANNLSGFSNLLTAAVPAGPDTTAPTVTITGPTNAATYTTSNGTLSLGGTATDNVAVTQVSWVNNRGGSGTATGTATWSATGIALQSGSNVLTVTARDAANNTSTDTLTVSYTPGVPTPPVAAYGFNENTGVTVLDASTNSNTGTIMGGATWVPGRFGSALSFDGVDDRVFVNSSSSVNLSAAMTLEAWVQPTAAQSDWRTIIQKETDAYFLNGSNDTGALRPSGGGTIGGSLQWTTATSPLVVGTWTHLALTYNGSVVQLYVNGVATASATASGPVQTTASPLWIGGNSPYGEFFRGLIDEVRVYDRALSQAEIQTDMTTPVP